MHPKKSITMLPEAAIISDWIPGLPLDIPPLYPLAPHPLDQNPFHIELRGPFLITVISGLAKLILLSPIWGTLFTGATVYFATRAAMQLSNASRLVLFLEKKAVALAHKMPYIYVVALIVALTTSSIFVLLSRLTISAAAILVALTIDASSYNCFFGIRGTH
jgi:hypothetical protein